MTNQEIKTVGQKWSDYQIQRFNINAQPYYVILNDNDSVIAPTRSLDTDVEAYIKWLTEAREAYHK